MHAPPDLEKNKQAAKAGNRVAQFNVGLWLLRGAEPGTIPEESVDWLLKSAKQDFPPAQTILGKILVKMERDRRDPARAVYWFHRAATAKFPEALYHLGELKIMGVGTPPDLEGGKADLLAAAEAGHAVAQTQLGYCAEQGIGEDRDGAAGIRWYAKAALSGFGRAQFLIGLRYATGVCLPPDSAKAMAWLRRAANSGYTETVDAVERLGQVDETRVGELLQSPREIDEPDSQTAAVPVRIEESILLSEPRISEFHELLDEAECAHIIAAARPFLKPSTVITNVEGDKVIVTSRTSQETGMADPVRDLVVWNIERRLAEASGTLQENAEHMMVLHYGTGDEYRPHVDFFDPRLEGNVKHLEEAGQRVITMLCYLNDVRAGGATHFPKLDLSVRPRRGAVLMFHNCRPDGQIDRMTLHAGTPVERGEKWLATRWIRDPDWTSPGE